MVYSNNFKWLYDNYFKNIIKESFKDIDPVFKDIFCVTLLDIDGDVFYSKLEKVYLKNRSRCKRSFLVKDKNNLRDIRLNNSKLAAVICQTFVKCKPVKIGFNKKQLYDYINDGVSYEQKKKKIIESILVNYRIAVNCGLAFICFGLLSHALEQKVANDVILDFANNLEVEEPKGFSFDDRDTYFETFVKTIARLDFSGKNPDVILSSLIFATFEELTYQKYFQV